MKLRTLVVTVAVLAVLSAVVAFLRRPAPPPSADARLGQPLLARSVLEQATQLLLSDQGKTVRLARQADGTWQVPDYYDLPVDFSKLTRLVDDLTAATLTRLVTSNPERLARLEFKDTRIELLGSADQVLWTATLGKNADNGGRFVRFGDEAKAWLASLNVWLDADPKNWADSSLLDLKAEDIARLQVTFPGSAPITFSRAKKDEPWAAEAAPAGQTVNAAKINSLLSTLTTLRFTETAEPDAPDAVAAQPHGRPLTLGTFDGRTFTVTLSRRPEEKKLKTPPAGSPPPLIDLAAKAATAGEGAAAPTSPDPKLLTPEFETIPAGPVFANITAGEAATPVNALMQKRAVKVSDYVFTSLPASAAELFAPAPAPAAAPLDAPKSGPGSP